ncbi:uncharacterized protein L203_100773 [Cryptococcus depauperatus CBS 7841]|uniref:Uncharacterized protein n=1 Tax=Cryptococcus depauperatus CBS 7841 TaxID=1295531 RepID=A0A1E3IXH0_9TREE|nr:hypothetical protein L203_00560 [Cryptococcus depauperatus CBS 7841]
MTSQQTASLAMAQSSTLPKVGRSSRKRGPFAPPATLRNYAEPRGLSDAPDVSQLVHPYANPGLNPPFNARGITPPPLDTMSYRHPPSPGRVAPILPTVPLNIRPRVAGSNVPTIAKGPLPPIPPNSSAVGFQSSDKIKLRVSSRPRAPGSKPPVMYSLKDDRGGKPNTEYSGGPSSEFSTKPSLNMRSRVSMDPAPRAVFKSTTNGPKRRPSLDSSALLDRREYPVAAECQQQSQEQRHYDPSHDAPKLPTSTMVPLKESNFAKSPLYDQSMSAPPISPPSSPHRRQRDQDSSSGQAESSATAQKKWKKEQQQMLGTRAPPFSATVSKSFDFDRSLSGRNSVDALRPMITFGDGSSSSDEEERRPSGGKSNMKKKSTAALRALFGRGASGSKGKKADDSTSTIVKGQTRNSSGTRQDLEEPSQPLSGRSTPTFHVEGWRNNLAETPPIGKRNDNKTTPPTSLDSSSSSSAHQKAPSRNLPPPPEPSPIHISACEGHSLTETSTPLSMPSIPSLIDSYEQPQATTSTVERPASPLLSLSLDSSPLFPSKPSSPKSRRWPATANSKPDTSPKLPLAQLLQLPDLDLDFHFEFDKFLLSSSPLRSSPFKDRGSPHSPNSPTRSLSTRSPVRPSISSGKLQRSWTVSQRSSDSSSNGSPLPPKFNTNLSPNPLNDKDDYFRKSPLHNSSNSTSGISPARSPSPPTLSQIPSSEDVASNGSTHETTTSAPLVTPKETTPTRATFTEAVLTHSVSVPVEGPEVRPKEEKSVEKPPALAPLVIVMPKAPTPQLALAPPAVITSPPPRPPMPQITQPVKPKPRTRTMVLLSRSQTVVPYKSLSIASLATKAEDIWVAFKYPEANLSSSDRSASLRAELIPLIEESNSEAYNARKEKEYDMLRSVYLRWISVLLSELRFDRPVDERGAVLESVAALFESVALSDTALKLSKDHREKFTQLMVRCMTFVMEKLGGRGVFQNILVFSGQFLAFAYFRVPHVAHQLLTVLQLPKGALMRFTGNIPIDASCPPEIQPQWPEHLLPLCFDNVLSYTSRLNMFTAEFDSEEEREAFLFPPGYWLRRWQSDDSELFPSFYRAYHKQLAQHFGPAVKFFEKQNKPIPAALLMKAPGYAHLATVFAKKLHSYIMGTVNAVTTCSAASNFDATESALQAPNAKPPVLVTTNRRLSETLMMFSEQQISIPVGNEVIECEASQIYMSMVDIWMKNLITKTSINAPKGVFCLFDLLDGIIDPPNGFTPGVPMRLDSVIDVPYLIHVIKVILTETEHAMTIVKAIAFVFSHWEVLTARPEDRKELCLDLLLDKEIFERLLLFWSHSVRSYVLRLVVFRLGRLESTTPKQDDLGWELEVQTVRLLQTRLDCIKRRHDELEPKTVSDSADQNPMAAGLSEEEESQMLRSRSTITMVADAPTLLSTDNAERLLGLGVGEVKTQKGGIEVDPTNGSNKFGKAAKWLKKNFGNKKKGKLSVYSPGLLETSPSPSSDGGDSLQLGPNRNLTDASRVSANPRISSLLPPATPPKDAKIKVSNEDDETTLDLSLTTTPPSRKHKPPTIITTPSDSRQSQGGFTFEFELPTMSPRSDAFDPPTPTSPRRSAKSSSSPRKQPVSPHMSKSFSKRSSLLPPSTANALNSIMESEKEKNEKEKKRKMEADKLREEKGYDKRLHPYAIRMFGELEDAQKEYDEWWSDTGYGKLDGLPPRLTVAWPFHENED